MNSESISMKRYKRKKLTKLIILALCIFLVKTPDISNAQSEVEKSQEKTYKNSYEDLFYGIAEKLENLKYKQEDQEYEIKYNKYELNDHKKRTAEVLNSIVDKLIETNNKLEKANERIHLLEDRKNIYKFNYSTRKKVSE